MNFFPTTFSNITQWWETKRVPQKYHVFTIINSKNSIHSPINAVIKYTNISSMVLNNLHWHWMSETVHAWMSFARSAIQYFDIVSFLSRFPIVRPTFSDGSRLLVNIFGNVKHQVKTLWFDKFSKCCIGYGESGILAKSSCSLTDAVHVILLPVTHLPKLLQQQLILML